MKHDALAIVPRSNGFLGLTVHDPHRCAQFYVEHFDFSVMTSGADFCIVRAPNESRVIGFGAPSEERSQVQTFGGHGIHLAFQVEDLEGVFAQFSERGLTIARGIHTESWGERNFVVQDPACIEVYIAEGPKPLEAAT